MIITIVSIATTLVACIGMWFNGWYASRLSVTFWRQLMQLQEQYIADMKEARAAGDLKAWENALERHEALNTLWDNAWPEWEKARPTVRQVFTPPRRPSDI